MKINDLRRRITIYIYESNNNSLTVIFESFENNLWGMWEASLYSGEAQIELFGNGRPIIRPFKIDDIIIYCMHCNIGLLSAYRHRTIAAIIIIITLCPQIENNEEILERQTLQTFENAMIQRLVCFVLVTRTVVDFAHTFADRHHYITITIYFLCHHKRCYDRG